MPKNTKNNFPYLLRFRCKPILTGPGDPRRSAERYRFYILLIFNALTFERSADHKTAF